MDAADRFDRRDQTLPDARWMARSGGGNAQGSPAARFRLPKRTEIPAALALHMAFSRVPLGPGGSSPFAGFDAPLRKNRPRWDGLRLRCRQGDRLLPRTRERRHSSRHFQYNLPRSTDWSGSNAHPRRATRRRTAGRPSREPHSTTRSDGRHSAAGRRTTRTNFGSVALKARHRYSPQRCAGASVNSLLASRSLASWPLRDRLKISQRYFQ